jgi:hypothetical protein
VLTFNFVLEVTFRFANTQFAMTLCSIVRYKQNVCLYLIETWE